MEDNPTNRDLLVRRLRQAGFETAIAADGESGIAAARRERPALILMDIGFGPGTMDGWEATRRLKADQATTAIPVIAVTGDVGAEHRQTSLDAGCCEFETKPVDFPRLLGKIRAALARSVSPAAASAPPAQAGEMGGALRRPQSPAGASGWRMTLSRLGATG